MPYLTGSFLQIGNSGTVNHAQQPMHLEGLQVQFNGMTPLGTNLNQKVIQPFLMGGIQTRNLSKPILVIIITDGEPTGEPKTTVAQVIKNAKNMAMSSPYGPGAIAFEFAQVGKDQAAQAFLAQLDKDPGKCSTSALTSLAIQEGHQLSCHRLHTALLSKGWQVGREVPETSL